jgi:hypothetical protein
LRPLEAIECRDALIDKDAKGNISEAKWPKAEFIIGNPPFLDIRLMRTGLGDESVEKLFSVYKGRVSREADFVAYWFEKARTAFMAQQTRRAGLVAPIRFVGALIGKSLIEFLSRPGFLRGGAMSRG